MLNPRSAAKPNPYAAAGVVPRSDRDKVVPFGTEGQRHGRRVERGTTHDGRPLFKVVIPTPRRSDAEDAIPLYQWVAFPCLAEPVAHAFLDLCRKRRTPHSRRTLLGSLAHFARFLAGTVEAGARGGFTLKSVTTSQVGAYIKWLDRTDPKTGAAALAVGTRRQALDALRSLVGALRRGRWAADVGQTLQVRNHAWVGASRQSTPTEVIPREEFAHLYRACVAEVVEVREAVEQGRRMVAAARDRVPAAAESSGAYDQLDVRLAAINALWHGSIPNTDVGLRTHPELMRAVLRFGGSVAHSRCFQPSPRDLVPFVVLLTIHTAYNPDTILGCTLDDVTREPGLGAARTVVAPADSAVDGDAAERVTVAAFKGRAKAKQPRSFPVTADPDNPAELFDFLARWTERIRRRVPPRHANRVFLFVPTRRSKAPTSYENERGALSVDKCWSYQLDAFCRRHGLRRFTLKRVRHTVIDLAHELSGGDLRAVLAVGGQRSADTIDSHYTSGGARQRNFEELATAGTLMWRDRMTSGRADARRAAEFGRDVGAATPGWGCLDPYESPIPGQRRGRACEAYGRCPGCPLAQLDAASPVSCAQAHDLLGRVDEARETIGPLNWIEKWGPLRKRLAEYWLTRFPEGVRANASLLHIRRLPPVE